ncbi:hypothetical protein GRI39_00765 [Altererythrobacter indicus]|uniref:histidine kinase n=1 Tax=Altericroceibacterium indicum TaxID=374177 RepID=A0A845A6C5_9SPHN|nr:hypothetical protein [Altericroceibacterium indicum]
MAAASLAAARLNQDEWDTLIPQLPIAARGFLRHRDDLPKSAERILHELGVEDLVLAGPQDIPNIKATTVGNDSLVINDDEKDQVANYVEGSSNEIEAIDLKEQTAPEPAQKQWDFCDFGTDRNGLIIWATKDAAPFLVGKLLHTHVRQIDSTHPRLSIVMRRRQPLKNFSIKMDIPNGIDGLWQLDATPMFDRNTGRFTGYAGRLARRSQISKDNLNVLPDSPTDRIRQMLHELRTPVNAIQGFAEVIQQQVLGPAPNEYRALSAGIAVDAARLMAGFEEVDRLTKLQSGAIEINTGQCDLHGVVTDTIKRLEGPLRPRGAALGLRLSGDQFNIGLAHEDAQQLIWRVLATIAGALSPGEVIEVTLSHEDNTITLTTDLPAALKDLEDIFAPSIDTRSRPLSAGMFGQGFTLRLARAESKAAGGHCLVDKGKLLLTLPALTTQVDTHSQTERKAEQPSAILQ